MPKNNITSRLLITLSVITLASLGVCIYGYLKGNDWLITFTANAFAIAVMALGAILELVHLMLRTGTPPRIAEWLLRGILNKKFQENLLGCLEEEYRDILHTQGPIRAYLWYWLQAVKSSWPLLRWRVNAWINQFRQRRS
jgi:hypothetical protein